MKVPLSVQARDIARKVYRASAVAACKAAFCKYFPQIFKAKGKGIRKAVAKKYQGAHIPHRNEAHASRGSLLQLCSCTAFLS